MVSTQYFAGSTQHSSDETLATYWFSVSALIAHWLYHQTFDPICVAFRRISGYAPLRSPCTIPTPFHSLPGNPDANFPNSDPLRRNSGSGSRHVSPLPKCPRLLARSTLERNHTLRQQREESHPPPPYRLHRIESFRFHRSTQSNRTKTAGGIS